MYRLESKYTNMTFRQTFSVQFRFVIRNFIPTAKVKPNKRSFINRSSGRSTS
jgi:hypothetical protein